jgi:hypothetical protein
MKPKQLSFLKPQAKSYGGELLKTRKGRRGPRPIDTRATMHLVLRSSMAKGEWSFRRPRNQAKIREIVDKFSARHGVRVLSLANVGNHLHFHLKIGNRFTYKPFIRAVTAAIAMAVTGASRWKRLGECARERRPGADEASVNARVRFWDYRPFTRIVQGLRAFLTLRDYIRVNQFEGAGYLREEARSIIAYRRERAQAPPPRA